jgi:predicted nucleic acid-binding protein
MTCVVDASVALKWFFADEPHATEALSLVQSGEAMIAPDLLIAETCNAAWKSFRLGRIEQGELSDIAAIIPRFLMELVGATSLTQRAAIIAVQLAHPIYDCLYIALAEARQVPLITADVRLLAKLAGSSWAAGAFHLENYRARP